MTKPPLRIAARPRATGGPRGKGCELGDLFSLLGQSFVLDILHLFMAEGRPRRFIEIQRALSMSPNTLTVRLHDLVGAGLLTRTAYNEIPPRVEYALTPKAMDLEAAFRVLDAWSKSHTLAPEARPVAA